MDRFKNMFLQYVCETSVYVAEFWHLNVRDDNNDF